eukprot:GHUV01008147.1.p1 GENE.GHUV01008147.1~~GHUV01008147.1.p1  ORF type:complete len:223 (+),score=42.67 GHUV01008147.1:574-1242(+)
MPTPVLRTTVTVPARHGELAAWHCVQPLFGCGIIRHSAAAVLVDYGKLVWILLSAYILQQHVLRVHIFATCHCLQFEWLCREKIADGPLIAKWRKPGYEILCSMLAIQKGNHNFGTTSHCRVPLRLRAAQQRVTPDVQTGCVSCASGDGKFGGPIWWNTPMDDGEAQEESEQQNRSTWGPAGVGDNEGSAPEGRKRAAAEFDDEDELPDEFRARLEALKKQA